MVIVWEVKMRALLCLVLAASCVLADKNDNRRNKLPFVADAVGNSLPPPSNVPATVGSPVNLLTPDRYEFYTFDESGELVKRLMTLEEIQAIVAAGEEAEGLVTFANENQPTVSFNINQPPYTKVHSVVTNVQNVLKAQMEAHRNKPMLQPTLDTPDVSDSWSLILPSIFGNTGVDIVLDKASGSVTTPETETLEENIEDEENSLSKEGTNQVISSSTTQVEDKVVTEKSPATVESKEEPQPTTTTSTSTTTTTTSTTTTTPKPPTTTRKATSTTHKPTTTTRKPTTTTRIPTTVTRKPTTTTEKATTTTTTTTTTTEKPTTTTTKKATTTTKAPTTTTTTRKPTTSTTTTKKPTTINIETRISPTASTAKVTATPRPTTTHYVLPDKEPEVVKVQIQPNANAISSTEKNEIEFERISTFIPVSTVEYITDQTTRKPEVASSTTKRSVTTTTTTEIPKIQTFETTSKPVISTTNYVPSTVKEQEVEKLNITTITTQSVSPSTTVSSTEISSADNLNGMENNPLDNEEYEKEPEPLLPMFDVAQSISQIASDLGGGFQPLPTTNNLLDTTKVNVFDLESKEVMDMDIPSGNGNETEIKSTATPDTNNDNFVKISTLDPHDEKENKEETKENDDKLKVTLSKETEKLSTENKISEPTQTSSNDNEKSNIIINNIQKVELFTTTETATEYTTIDPILSESMGDLLSQISNEAPQSIVNSETTPEKETKVTTTEESLHITTKSPVLSIDTTSETSNKVKKETSTTTETPAIVTTNVNVTKENVKIDENLEDNKNKIATIQDETPASSKPQILKPVDINNGENNPDDKSDDTHNFVQISVSTDNKSKVEPISSENKNNIDKPVNKKEDDKVKENAVKNDENVKIQNEKEMTKNGNKSVETTKTNDQAITRENITSSSPAVETTSSTTPTPPKTSQSKFNKINVSDKIATNKKDKLPEPLPKVDDFKKKIQKVNIDEEELVSERNSSWKLIPTLSPPKANEIPKDKTKSENHYIPDNNENKDIVLEFSTENQGLEVTTKDLGEDVARFSELSNELAFRFWNVMIDDIDKKRSFVLSPYSIFSMLAMIFMGARGATSGEMNEILKLDDMVTFNPHFTLKNISDSIETTPESGVAVSAFIRELYSDRNKGKILTFYKERAQHFYNGHVEEINFKLISDIIRRRTNLLVKRYTWGKIPEYMKTNNIVMQPPLAAFTANIFETDCSGTSVEGRDGEMYFVVSPNVRQRRLVPVPAVVYKSGFLAGYDPALDATAAALGNTNSVISTLFLMPGQQGNVVHADDLEKLEQRLLDAVPTTPTWNRVLRTLLPRTGLELQIPRFSHKSTFNVSMSLKKMGLKDLFDGEHADLGGLNGPSKDLYLSDMVQLNTFVTCGEGGIGEQHHIEEYPETLSVSQRRRARWLNDWDEPRDYQRAFHDPHDVGDAMHLPLHLRPRQARLPSRSALPARLKFDRPFLYFVRHNPSGMILYFGRYNPRLLP